MRTHPHTSTHMHMCTYLSCLSNHIFLYLQMCLYHLLFFFFFQPRSFRCLFFWLNCQKKKHLIYLESAKGGMQPYPKFSLLSFTVYLSPSSYLISNVKTAQRKPSYLTCVLKKNTVSADICSSTHTEGAFCLFFC